MVQVRYGFGWSRRQARESKGLDLRVADSDLVFEWSRRLWLPISRSPRLFPSMVRMQRKRRNVPACAGRPIVIDGFPRSANTFSFARVPLREPGVAASHHMHAPANVLLAVRYGIPDDRRLRPPVDAVLSEVIREPRKRLRRGSLEWNSFYSTVRPVLDRVVVADFATVTSDYSLVIDEVNRRFGTSFATYPQHPSKPTRRCSRRSKPARDREGRPDLGSRPRFRGRRRSGPAKAGAGGRARATRAAPARRAGRRSSTPSFSPSLLGLPERRPPWLARPKRNRACAVLERRGRPLTTSGRSSPIASP